MNKLIRLVAAGDDFTGEFACNLAALGETTVHALSCAGDHTAVRFLHAAMRDQGSVKFRFSGLDEALAGKRLRLLEEATSLEDFTRLASIGLHRLRGDRRGQWAISAGGPWRIVFEFRDGDAWNVEIVDYH